MIEDYRALAIFVAVADAGSFSGASRQLKLSTSVVSHHISRLENKLGVSLFFRSTRSLSLAPEGKAILDHARNMVRAGEAALDVLTISSDQPVGALKISMPAFGFANKLHGTMWSFAAKHPLVSLRINYSDARADLVKDGYDLALRLGVLPDSSLKCRKVGDLDRILVCTPDYLQKFPAIEAVEDLNACEFISVSMIPDTFDLLHGNNSVTFEPKNIRLEVDSVAAAKSAVLDSLGVRQLPFDDIEEELQNGQLVRLLPDWSSPIVGVYAVWPDVGPQKQLTRLLIDHLADNA